MKRLVVILIILPFLASCSEGNQMAVVKSIQQPVRPNIAIHHNVVQKHAVQTAHRRILSHNRSERSKMHGHPDRQVHRHGHSKNTIVAIAPPSPRVYQRAPNVHGHPNAGTNPQLHVHREEPVNTHQHGHDDREEVIIHGHD